MNCPCPEHTPAAPHQQVRPAVVGVLGGQPVYGYSRLADGRWLCQLCIEYVWPCQLDEPKPGIRADICRPCADTERITWRCPRCSKVIVNADHKLYEWCPHCEDHTGQVKPHEVCMIHYRWEPDQEGDYKACLECRHVWRTEQEFIDDVLADRRQHAEATLRYEGYTPPADLSDPLTQTFCPLCTHDF